MFNRRELIAASVALSLPAKGAAARLIDAVGGTGAGVAAGTAPAGHFIAALGVAGAASAAEAAARRGANIIWLGQDLTPVYEWLDLALRPAPFAFAGLTSAQDFFVLERLAWDRGLRTVLRRTPGADTAGAAAPGTARSTALEWRLEPRARA